MTQITSQNEQKEKTIRPKRYTKMIFLATEPLLMYPQSVKKQTIILTQKSCSLMLSITRYATLKKLIYNRKAFDSKDFSPNIAPKADEKQLIT